MKKILLWVILSLNILLAYFLLQPVQAATNSACIQKTFVCKVGTSYYNQLSYPGYKMISSNVDFNHCGRYQIIYENEITKERVEKQIEVRSETDLIDGMVLQENIELYFKNNQNYIFHQTKKAEDGNYVVSYLHPKEGREEVYDIGIMKLNLEEILFQTTIFTQVRGRIVDFIMDQGKIVLLIEKENISTRQDLYVVVLNEVGQILFENCYFGSGIEFGRKLLMDQDYYYIVGETTSSDEYFLSQQLYKSGFVFCIQKKDYQLTSRYYLSNPADTEVIDATIQNQNVVILTRYFDTSKRMKVMDIWYFNHRSNSGLEKKHFTTTLTETFLKLKIDENNQLYVATNDYLYSIQKYVTNLYYLKENYEKELIYQTYCSNQENATFLDFIPLNNQEQVILFSLYRPNQEKSYGYLYQMVEDSEVKVEIENYFSDESIQGFVADSTVDLVLANQNSLSIHHIVFLYIQYESYQQITSFTSFIYPLLYTHQNRYEIDEKLSSLPLNENIFGDYDICYVFVTEELEVVFEDKVRIVPIINIASHETYDLNTELTFNGKGYLNDCVIASGHKIENEGEYTFILEGIQQEQVEIHFRIAHLSNSDVVKRKEEPVIQNHLLLSNEIIENQVTFEDAINQNLLQKEYRSSAWFIFLPLSILIALYIYIRKRG